MKNATLSVAQNISHWLDLSRGPVLQLTLRCIRIPSPCSLRAVFGGRGGRGGNQQKKGPTLHLDLFVNLKDLYLGAQIEVEISKQVVCDRCRGSGAKSHEDVVRPTHCASRHAPCGLKIEHLCLPPPLSSFSLALSSVLASNTLYTNLVLPAILVTVRLHWRFVVARCSPTRGALFTHLSQAQCKKCRGKGIIITQHQLGPGFVQQMQSECPKCGGKGKTIKKKCPTCRGRKVIHGTDDLTIDIEKGMPDGHRLTFPRAGDQSSDIDTTPGDVVYTIKTEAHKKFTRRGNDLYMTQPITLAQAINGFQLSFEVPYLLITYNG